MNLHTKLALKIKNQNTAFPLAGLLFVNLAHQFTFPLLCLCLAWCFFFQIINVLLFSSLTEPDVIRNLRVTNITTSSVFLTWTEPFGNRSFFKLHWTDDKTNKTTTNTSYNITGLNAGVNYTFCITAVAADQSTEGETVCISQFTSM